MTRFGAGKTVRVLALASMAAAGTTGAEGQAQQVVDLPAQDKLLPASLEDVFRVGSMAGADWETFGDVRGVAFDAQGRLYIFDQQGSRVVVTDSRGRLVRTVGKAGEGPGELRMPVAFTALRDGTVVIADMGHRAYQVFDPDGSFRRMVSFAPSGDGSMIRLGDMAPDPRGGAIFSAGGTRIVSMSREGLGAPPALPGDRPIEHVSLTGERTEARLVASGWQPPRPADRAPVVRGGGGAGFVAAVQGPRAFEPPLLMGPLADGGVAYCDSTAYAVKVVGSTGVLERVIRRPFAPRAVTAAIQEAEKARRLAELEAGGGPQIRIVVAGPGGGGGRPLSQDAIKEMMRNQIAQLEFYPELPVLLDLKTGWSGKIWVVRRGEKPAEPGAVDVLTAAGQYVGTFAAGSMRVPAAFGPEGLVAFVERDQFDVPTVVVKRLPAVLR